MDEITEDRMIGLGVDKLEWVNFTEYQFPKAGNGVWVSVVFSGESRPRVYLYVDDSMAEMPHIQSYRELISLYHTVTGNVIVTYGLSEVGVKQGVVSIGGSQ